jgi:hypothetical protein
VGGEVAFSETEKYLMELPRIEGAEVVILRSPKAAEEWLEGVRKDAKRGTILNPLFLAASRRTSCVRSENAA